MRIRIATRVSNLAMAQAHEVKRRLINQAGILEQDIEIIGMKTTGDLILDKNLAEIGGKGLFTKEIEEALLDNRADIAVHSMKDVPAFLPDGLVIPCILPREDPRDALLTINNDKYINALPKNALVGTSSTRRKAQLLELRPDLEVVSFRGNVNTRINKLENGQVQATFLAMAGLKRLNLSTDYYMPIDEQQMLPAVAQGAIGVECRVGDDQMLELISHINHLESQIRVSAERAYLTALGAGCTTPIAALANINGEMLSLNCMFAENDKIYRTKKNGHIKDAVLIGQEAGEEIISNASLG